MTSISDPALSDESRYDAFISFLRDSSSLESFSKNPLQCLIDNGFSIEDAAYIVEQNQKIIVYYVMLRNTMRDVIFAWLPRCCVLLGKPALVQSIDLFLAQSKPSSHFLRLIPREFVQWIIQEWSSNHNLPAFACDLARFDLLEQDVRNDPQTTGEQPCSKLELDLPACCNKTAQRLRFDWQVNKVPRTPKPHDSPLPGVTEILAFRGPSGITTYTELCPFSSRLFEQLQNGYSLKYSLESASEHFGQSLDDALLRRAAFALAEWMDTGAIFGALQQQPLPTS